MHLVTFVWNEGVSPEQVDELSDELSRLPKAIPELRAYHFGRDLGLRPGNGDYGVCAVVETPEGIAAYLDHPEHRRVVTERISQMAARRSAVQIQVADVPHV